MTTDRSRAVGRLMRVVPDERLRMTDPVAWADGRTSGADARTALCLVTGVPLDRIDPATGNSIGPIPKTTDVTTAEGDTSAPAGGQVAPPAHLVVGPYLAPR